MKTAAEALSRTWTRSLCQRSTEDVLRRIELVTPSDTFCFARQVLIFHGLSSPQSRPFLQEHGSEPVRERSTLEAIEHAAIEYLEFAWDKALNHRGISASRSVTKLTEFLWLLGLDVDVEFSSVPYQQYGTPILKRCAELLGQPVPTRPELERMMRGEPCQPGCEEGCGRE